MHGFPTINSLHHKGAFPTAAMGEAPRTLWMNMTQSRRELVATSAICLHGLNVDAPNSNENLIPKVLY
jgi:hypothetical protein